MTLHVSTSTYSRKRAREYRIATTDSDRTSHLGLRISAALLVALGCNFAFDVLFFNLHLFFPRFADGVAVEVLLAPRLERVCGEGENDGDGGSRSDGISAARGEMSRPC